MTHPTLPMITEDTLAQLTPAGLMVLDTHGKYEVPPHLEYLTRLLLQFTRDVKARKSPRLIISMPPRHGKSTMVSHYFPTWWLGNWPTDRIIVGSYGADYARGWSRKCRNTLSEHGPRLWGITVSTDVSTQHDWETTKGGGMLAVGRGGPITGRGANVIIIDDPLKDPEEARSPIVTEGAYNWIRAAALTRLEPGGGAIIMATRWSQLDPIGRLLEAQAAGEFGSGEYPWQVINLPALADPDITDPDPLGRTPGEALWPTRYTVQDLKRKRAEVGPTWFAALYQGVPRPEEGALFRRQWFRYWTDASTHYVLHTPGGERRVPKDVCQVVSFMDPAATEDEQASFTVITTWAITPEADSLLLDMQREQVETTRHQAMIDATRARWSPSVVGVEKAHAGISVIQALAAKGYPIKPVRADRDKVARARVAEARYEAGKVYHPRAVVWGPTFETELLDFPLGRHDDIVDTVSMMSAYVALGVELSLGEPLDIGGAFSAVDESTEWWKTRYDDEVEL